MKIRWILLAMASLTGLLLASGIAYAEEWQGKGETKTVTGIQVELITPAEGLKVGENNLAVRMKEAASGQAVVRDLVRGDLAMDEGDKSMNHGSMSSQKPVAFELKAVAGQQGRYEGKVTLSDPGDWNVRVFTDSRGVGSPASFEVRAEKASPVAATNKGAAAPQAATNNTAAAPQPSGPNWLVLGGLALLVVVGIGGVVARVKRPSAPIPATPAQETNKA